VSDRPRGEFQLIAELFAPLATHPGARGLTDDCAYLGLAPGEELVLKTDAVVAGVDFLPNAQPEHVAAKALRINLSDLAAKGARPIGYLQTLGLPRQGIDDAWLTRYAASLAAEQQRFGVALLGGDITATEGPFWASITMLGAVAQGRAPLRSAAKVGDRVFVTGTIGDAALGLAVRRGSYMPSAEDCAFLVDRYDLPQPRLAEGQSLHGIAHASADVSDGLVADLDHIAQASGVGIEIDAARVPLSAAARRAVVAEPGWLARLLVGGDDYEIAFTAAADPPAEARATEIGRVIAGQGVSVRDAAGQPMRFERTGYQHI
jgi:thiamine-monophosphate kinase